MTIGEDVFVRHRNLLFRVAHGMLGSTQDAEDVVQETWLVWAGVDAESLEHPRAYLVRIAVRQAMRRLRRLRDARADYVGPWLPEPLLASADPAEDVLPAEELTCGLLLLLETLSPLERAAFVLREAFGYEHAEIAGILGRSTTAVRQLTHRARAHVQARRPRFPVSPGRAHQAAERFLAATRGGDLRALMDILAPDVTLWTDGGGAVPAALRPVRGTAKVTRLLSKLGPRYTHLQAQWIPGSNLTVLLSSGDTVSAVLVLDTDPSGDRVQHIYAIVNPHKLNHLTNAVSNTKGRQPWQHAASRTPAA